MEIDTSSVSRILHYVHYFLSCIGRYLHQFYWYLTHMRSNRNHPFGGWHWCQNVAINIIIEDLSSQCMRLSEKHWLTWSCDCQRSKEIMIVRVESNVICAIFAIMLTFAIDFELMRMRTCADQSILYLMILLLFVLWERLDAAHFILFRGAGC